MRDGVKGPDRSFKKKTPQGDYEFKIRKVYTTKKDDSGRLVPLLSEQKGTQYWMVILAPTKVLALDQSVTMAAEDILQSTEFIERFYLSPGAFGRLIDLSRAIGKEPEVSTDPLDKDDEGNPLRLVFPDDLEGGSLLARVESERDKDGEPTQYSKMEHFCPMGEGLPPRSTDQKWKVFDVNEFTAPAANTARSALSGVAPASGKDAEGDEEFE